MRQNDFNVIVTDRTSREVETESGQCMQSTVCSVMRSTSQSWPADALGLFGVLSVLPTENAFRHFSVPKKEGRKCTDD